MLQTCLLLLTLFLHGQALLVSSPQGHRSRVILRAGFGGAPSTSSKKKSKKATAACPCGSGERYALCCKPYHEGRRVHSAETLLRARFSAFARKEIDFIMDTTYPANREEDARAWRGKIAKGLDSTRFTSLRILEEEQSEDTASILFEAGMQPLSQRGQGAKAIVVTEKANFILLPHDETDGTWFYANGTEINAVTSKGATPS